MKMQEIRKDPLLVKFFRKRRQKEPTRKTYAYHLLNYYKATGLTPTEAIKEAHEDQDTINRLSERRIEDRQLDYIEYLEDKNASLESIRHGLSMIRTFYAVNDVILPKPPRLTNESEYDEEGNEEEDTTERLPDLEDIKKAILKSTPLYQSVIVLMASSGMGRGEILNLTIKNLINALSRYKKITLEDLQDIPLLREKLPKHIGPLEWRIKRAKMRYKGRKPYLTFSTPESLEYLLRYMTGRPKPKTTKEKLYINRQGKPLSEVGFDSYFSSLNRRCGWGLKGKQAYFRSHNLRKWMANQLEPTSLVYINTNRMLGHEPLNKTDSRYFKTNPEILYNLYYENMDAVSLFGKIEVHDKTDEKVKELEAEMESMRKSNLEMQNFINQMMRQDQQPKP